jgi:DNA-binding Lrp family transcriptional regulator
MAKNKLPEIKTDKVTHYAVDMWVAELILLAGKPDYALAGFLHHFTILFKGLSMAKGIHLSQREISEHMGISERHVKTNLTKLVELGILSYARKSFHPRAGGVYFINLTRAHEFDARAEACKLEDTRKEKAVEETPAKSEVVILAEKELVEAIEQVTEYFTKDLPKAANLVRKHLINDGTVASAAKALLDITKKSLPVTVGTFEAGLKDRRDPFTPDQWKEIQGIQSELTRLRAAVKQAESPVEAPEYSEPTETYVAVKSWAKTPEQIKAEEAARREDAIAEKKRLTEEEIQREFEDLLRELA